MKLGAMDFGSFNATQLLGAWLGNVSDVHCCEGNLGSKRWQIYQLREQSMNHLLQIVVWSCLVLFYLVGHSILNALVAWRQILSYKLCVICLARRGNIKVLHSDNGSIFVGAQKELEKTYNERDHQKIQFSLQNIGPDYINWHRNPPASSHIGGVWERQIRSTHTEDL